MRRREVVASLIGAVAWPREMAAQPAQRTTVWGSSRQASSYETLRGQLAKLGFIEGRILWATCA